ncbi:MAG: transposase [Euryarchaeota archaeon]|nr:transposase [Euryarchaeota archaeon]
MVRASKLSPEQRLEVVVAFLGGKGSMAELCREHGVSSQTIYVWRDKFLEGELRGLQGNGPSEREEALERENTKLKELLGNISMANYVLKRGQVSPLEAEGGACEVPH